MSLDSIRTKRLLMNMKLQIDPERKLKDNWEKQDGGERSMDLEDRRYVVYENRDASSA